MAGRKGLAGRTEWQRPFRPHRFPTWDPRCRLGPVSPRSGAGRTGEGAASQGDERFGASGHSPAPQPEEGSGPEPRVLISPQPRTTPEGGDSATSEAEGGPLGARRPAKRLAFPRRVPHSLISPVCGAQFHALFRQILSGLQLHRPGAGKYVRTSLTRGGCRRSGISAPNVNPPEVERALKKKQQRPYTFDRSTTRSPRGPCSRSAALISTVTKWLE